VFPVEIDLDNPKFHVQLERLLRVANALAAAKAQGGFVGRVKRLGLTAAAAAHFARLFLLPARRNALPAQVRLSPAW
jgi:magnesium-protoporphyrin IX monomethyl ester (oxidative) cyclase